MWNVMLPLFLISNVSLAAFSLSPGDSGDRLGVGVTVLLTIIAFKIFYTDHLPRISYLTCLDK
jgi:hypothetical protein